MRDVVVRHDDGLELRFLLYNESWYPRDDAPRPEPGTVFMTFLVEVHNGSAGVRSFDRDDFALRTLEGTPHEGPVWEPRPAGREPVLSGATLAPGESARGWLTFHLPELSHLDELLWRPASDVVYAIWLPPQHSGLRYGRALVFGRVDDAHGDPVPGMKILINPIQVIPAVPGHEITVGGCVGSGKMTPLKTRTDERGWYEVSFEPVHVDLSCVDVQAIPPEGSGLGPARASGTVRTGRIIPMAEPPEVRVDLTMQKERKD